jgi:hypothetical protein
MIKLLVAAILSLSVSAKAQTLTTVNENLWTTGNWQYFDTAINGASVFSGTVTVVGNAFSVGASSFTVHGGSATVAYGLTAGGVTIPGTSITSTGTTIGASGINSPNGINVSSATGYSMQGSTILNLLPATPRVSDGNIQGGSLGIGVNAGSHNTGNYNVFIGTAAGWGNTTGYANTYIGFWAGSSGASLQPPQTAFQNTFVGAEVGPVITNGINNNCIGHVACWSITSGSSNTINGQLAGYYLTSGNGNVFEGQASGELVTTGNNNTFLGYQTNTITTTGSNNIMIGANAVPLSLSGSDSNKLNIGFLLTGDLYSRILNVSSATVFIDGTGSSLSVGGASGFSVTSGSATFAGNVSMGATIVENSPASSASVLVDCPTGMNLTGGGGYCAGGAAPTLISVPNCSSMPCGEWFILCAGLTGNTARVICARYK